ncbi:MAG: glycosyltransferase [Ignavibacteria bacterium]
MNKKIAILTSGHPPYDERIFHKIGMTFLKYGYKVNIICSTLKADKITEEIHLNGFDGSGLPVKEKIGRFIKLLSQFKPEKIICCEPVTLVAASVYKRISNSKVIVFADITEWYPENVANKLHGVKRIITYLKLFLFNIYAVNLADALIIGEKAKLRRYKLIAPTKKKEIIGYFPLLKYFNYSAPKFNGKSFTLCYAGLISFERGIGRILETAILLSQKLPDIKIRLKIAGKFQNDMEETQFLAMIKPIKSVETIMIPWGDYRKISDTISDADVCLDLRPRTFVYKHSLPIKIFEYMACGKPFIFSDIKPIRREMEADLYGFLVNPKKYDEITDCLIKYISDKELLLTHSKNARKKAEDDFNWEKLETRLISFVESFD